MKLVQKMDGNSPLKTLEVYRGKALNFSNAKWLVHRDRELDVIVTEEGVTMIVEWNDDGEIVVDTVKPSISIKQLKQLLDDNCAIISVCELQYTTVVEGESAFQVLMTLREVKALASEK
jgi:hypothetical protein